MDPYQRLESINESLMGRIRRFLTTPKAVKQFERAVADLDQKYSDLPENQPKPKRKNNRAVANFERMVADLDRKYSNQNESTETEKMDQEFDDARDALRKAGVPNMGLRAIGSMDRERNRLRVHPKFEKEAKQALKGFPKVDLEINDKMPEKPMKRKVKEEVQKETDMDPYQRLEAINETLTRIFAEDLDPDRYVSVGDRKTVEFGRRTMDLSPEDRDKARRSADRKTAKEKRQAPKGSKAAHNVIADAGRRYRVGTQRPTDPDDPKHENLRIAAAINAAIARGMSDE